MAGHSKWANIKYRKGRADAAKGKVFSRITKEIISAVKHGGPDPKTNSRLRLVLNKARSANLPKENIERNIKKASSSDQSDFFEMTYELYGHNGVGIIAEVMTDNKNRIASEIRIAINKKGGSIASPGAVSFNFDRKGVIQIAAEKIGEEKLFQIITEADAEDFELADAFFMVITAPERLYEIKEKIEAQNVICDEANLEMIPKTTIECDEETRTKNMELIQWLENLDDVDAVFHNMSDNN